MSNPYNGVCRLNHLGVIRAQGEEAAKFLHGQLTQDFLSLGTGQARLAAQCSAKGRMQASFIAFQKAPHEILLLCSADGVGATLQRLAKFVMRAKVKLSDASAELQVYGLLGEAATRWLGATTEAWKHVGVDGASVVSLYPSLGTARALWVAPAATPAPEGQALDPSLWLWTEVRSGVATVTAPVFEAFVPQMLNFESVGGVSFKKGCYPGQEVVARSQFRGTLKRRAFVVHCAAPLSAGQEVFHSEDPEQACGTIAQAAAAPDGGFDALLVMPVSAAQSGQLHLATLQGPALQLLELPYELLSDI